MGKVQPVLIQGFYIIYYDTQGLELRRLGFNLELLLERPQGW